MQLTVPANYDPTILPVLKHYGAFEVYGNVASHTYTPGNAFNQFLMMEGGTMLFWGNTTTGYKEMVMGDVVRANSMTYSQTSPPSGWGYCGSGVSGATSSWDGNTSTNGYPCIDQIGRGKGDLLSGNAFPVVNTSSGTQSWPNQALEPVYTWGNTFNAPTSEADFYWNESGDGVTVENRDYYLELPNNNESTSFNGTAGIGCGPSSSATCSSPVAQPSSCTTGVGYWNTSTSTLYKCTAANTWTASYTPYAYPHPLAAVTPSWGNMDYWFPMNGSPLGTLLSPAVLTAGTVGSSSWAINPVAVPLGFSIGQNTCGMPGSLTIGGVTYPATTPTQAITLNSALNFTYATATIGAGAKQAVANGCIVMGAATASPAFNGKYFDLVYFNDNTAANSVTLQINNGNPCYCVYIETNPGSKRSPGVTLVAGNTYWFSLLFDEVNGVAKLAVFDPKAGYTQVSGSPTTVAQTTGNTMKALVFGNGEIGISTGTFTFGSWVVDTSHAIWPNIPQSTGVTPPTPPAPPTNIKAVVN